jgi:cellulose synthase operon protein YhjQ
MADPLPDDVAALCNHAGIDSSLYKDFAAQRSASAAAVSSSTAADSVQDSKNSPGEDWPGLGPRAGQVAAPVVARQSKQAQSSTREIQPPSVLVERTEFAVVPTGAGGSNLVELPLPSHRGFGATHSSAAVAENPRAVRDRWSAIQDVFSHGTSENADAIAAHTLPCGSISVFAAGGGVGKTTIGATLARVLTSMGESVLLAGLTPDSILPLYFGARSASGGTLRSFLMPRDNGRGSLHLYLDSLSAAGRDGETEGKDLLDRLCSQAELVKDDVDHSVMVLPVGRLEALMPILRNTSICLAVIVPDLASAIGVGKLMRFFKEHEDQPISPYFLINKFDAARALHQEMRSRLQEQLGEHLLPVVIRRSDDIQDALAAGMTVIDYAPGTAVAQDFRHLAEWVAGHCGSGRAGQQK